MVLQVIKSKTKELFLQDKLIINRLYTLLPRRKKAFSLFLAISEDPLDKFVNFSIFSFSFQRCYEEALNKSSYQNS